MVAGRSSRRSYKFLESSRSFICLVALLIVALLVWMSVAEIDRVIRVQGKIIPAGKSQQIQHLEGGILSKISVQEGDLVHKGDLLLTIDNTLAGATLSENKVRLESARVHAARLQAEVDGKDKLDFPDDLASLTIAAAEQRLFEARRASLEQELAVHKSVITQRMAEYAEATSRKERLSSELVTATERTGLVENMARNQAASKLEVLDAKSRQQSLRTQLGDVSSMMPKLQAAIQEAKARIESARSEFKSQAQKELVETLAEIDRLTQVGTAAADRLRRTEIKAPVDGIINAIAVNTVGGVIKPGDRLIEITPFTDSVLVEGRALPRDRGYLKPGLKTEIRVSAYDPAEFGLLEGKVVKVGADSMQDADNQSFYQVNIVVNAIPDKYTGLDLIPGMTVTADVVTGRRTILAYLLSPLRKFSYNMFRDPR